MGTVTDFLCRIRNSLSSENGLSTRRITPSSLRRFRVKLMTDRLGSSPFSPAVTSASLCANQTRSAMQQCTTNTNGSPMPQFCNASVWRYWLGLSSDMRIRENFLRSLSGRHSKNALSDSVKLGAH